MPKNDLLNPSLLKSLFDTDILEGGVRRKVGNTTYSESGDKMWLMLIFIFFHTTASLNVARLCDLSSGASPVILGMFGGYVGGFFLLLLVLYILSTGRRKVNTLKNWRIFLIIFMLILLTLAIIAMAMSNEGSSSEKGYGYSSVLLINFGMLFLIWYIVRLKMRLVPGSIGDRSATMSRQSDYEPQNYAPGFGQGQGQDESVE
jgi:hypothetical protein